MVRPLYGLQEEERLSDGHVVHLRLVSPGAHGRRDVGLDSRDAGVERRQRRESQQHHSVAATPAVAVNQDNPAHASHAGDDVHDPGPGLCDAFRRDHPVLDHDHGLRLCDHVRAAHPGAHNRGQALLERLAGDGHLDGRGHLARPGGTSPRALRGTLVLRPDLLCLLGPGHSDHGQHAHRHPVRGCLQGLHTREGDHGHRDGGGQALENSYGVIGLQPGQPDLEERVPRHPQEPERVQSLASGGRGGNRPRGARRLNLQR
mmetsp:Transcript_48400/g.144549  ORF Transcript_48400/g.144549 Transcript_48400/m.144549 type:complete len:260 (-) Transcript_48400:805-1584(-)